MLCDSGSILAERLLKTQQCNAEGFWCLCGEVDRHMSEQDLYLGHVVVVQGEIGVLLVQAELHLVVVVAILRHDCGSYSV